MNYVLHKSLSSAPGWPSGNARVRKMLISASDAKIPVSENLQTNTTCEEL